MILILGAFIVTGCVPTRYSWSPDGKWMTVLSDDGLRLADGDGNLLSPAIGGVDCATWFPDSKRVLVSRQIDVKTWDEMSKYLTPEQTQDAIEAARHARDAALAYDWNAADPNDLQKFADAMNAQYAKDEHFQRVMKELGGAVALYVRDHRDAALQQKIPPQTWKVLGGLSQSVQSIEVYAVDATGATPGPRLMTSLKSIHELRVSPTGAAAIVVTDSEQAHASDLWVVPTDGTAPAVKFSDQAAWYPDWSSDGQEVLLVRAATPAAGDASRLGSVTRMRAIGEDGKVMNKPGEAQDLVGLVFDELCRVRSAKDGRILFDSAEVTLPTTANDMPQRPQLFSLTPGSSPMVSRLLPKQAFEQVGGAAQYFEVSPDGTHVSIPDNTGKVTVVDLRTGHVTVVQDKPVLSDERKPTLMTVPQWRSPDELTMISPGENGHPSVTLWSMSKNAGRTLSANWPAGMIEKKSASTQPATER
jgi:WD40 repeat protein